MDISADGLALIASFEGWVPHVYADVVGVRTIGYGHVLLPGESFPNGITKQQGDALLHRDVQKCVTAINTHVKVSLNQNQFDALCSFSYNVGDGALEGSTLLKLVNESNFANAALEFPKWAHAGNEVNQVLLARRKKEAALFLTPVEQTIFTEPAPQPIVVEPADDADLTKPVTSTPAVTLVDSKTANDKFTFALHWIILGVGFWSRLAYELVKHFR